MNFKKLPLIFLLLFLYAARLPAAMEYEVQFEGIANPNAWRLIQNGSETLKLRDRPPRSAGALQRRAEKDIQNLIQVYHSLAYYNAKIEMTLDDEPTPAIVRYEITEGPVYPLARFEFYPAREEDTFPYDCIPLSDLGIELDCPAYPKNILETEELFVRNMEKMGYPLAEVIEREVFVDQTSQEVSVLFTVESGPQALFGKTEIRGNATVCNAYLAKRISWQEGARYHPKEIDCTMNALESTGLFNSVSISYAPDVTDEGYLPMIVEVKEGSHRSYGLGLSYDTQRGIGGGFEWEHRNVRGMGERLSTNAFIWQKRTLASALYVIPDYQKLRTDLLLLAEYEAEQTKAFDESSFSLSAIIESQFNSCTRYSYGTMFKRLRNTKTDNDGDFNLLKFPMQLDWNNTIDDLNPCNGAALQLKVVPTAQLLDHQFVYSINTLTAALYRPVNSSCNTILAGKVLVGSIIGAGRKTIPGSERFYGGSDNTIRGYSFYTVSPLDRNNDPIGGRSILVFTAEARFRYNEQFGTVLFYDVGNVFEETLPTFNEKYLRSVGLGLRYFTPVAPLRVDIAFPLDRRKGLDNSFQIYFSVGQSF